MEVNHIVWLDVYTNRAKVERMLIETLDDQKLLRRCARGIRNFWLTLELEYGAVLPFPVGITIYHVNRFETEGQSALVQTVRWLERHGIKNPIVWNESDE